MTWYPKEDIGLHMSRSTRSNHIKGEFFVYNAVYLLGCQHQLGTLCIAESADPLTAAATVMGIAADGCECRECRPLAEDTEYPGLRLVGSEP